MFFFGKNKNDKVVKDINSFYEKYKNISKEEFDNLVKETKEIALKDTEKNKNALPMSFALTKIAAERTIGLTAYDVQLKGGIVLDKAKIAEMKTGEGKTLVAVFPAVYNAFTGKNVLIITVNDYLAKRDKEQMSQVFDYLGLTTGLIQTEYEPEVRKEEYSKNIVYVTNKEFGFDYLKDNRAYNKEHCVLPKLDYAIVDEVDSVLIDEARTPLIISAPREVNNVFYYECIKFIKSCKVGEVLDPDKELSSLSKKMLGSEKQYTGDIIVDEEFKNVFLTDEGIKKAEQYFNVENWASISNVELNEVMHKCLIAMFTIKPDVNYIIKDNSIQLVDNFTGRVTIGKKYQNGIHQALEAKHGLEITQDNIAIAQITYPNLFVKFDKLSGMTGTALTEKEEFMELYGLPIEVIETNKPVIRKDNPDSVFFTKYDKYEAIINSVKEAVAIERPVLIGTPNIKSNEKIAEILHKNGIKCNVLNAKYVEQEAEIIAKAGQKGSVTVATNMAGRGTDIMIDDYTRSVGGLLIIGAERHESRRIDNQLRGRAGRQGDPGESKFYVSLEDELFDFFELPPMIKDMRNVLDHTVEINLPIMSSLIEKAQKKIESINAKVRTDLMKEDNTLSVQREQLYEDRNKILKSENIFKTISDIFEKMYSENRLSEEDKEKLLDKLKNLEELDKRMPEVRKGVTQTVLLSVDKCWALYLESIADIKRQVWLNNLTGSGSQEDFKLNTEEAYDKMNRDIQLNIAINIDKIVIITEENKHEYLNSETNMTE